MRGVERPIASAGGVRSSSRPSCVQWDRVNENVVPSIGRNPAEGIASLPRRGVSPARADFRRRKPRWLGLVAASDQSRSDQARRAGSAAGKDRRRASRSRLRPRPRSRATARYRSRHAGRLPWKTSRQRPSQHALGCRAPLRVGWHGLRLSRIRF